MIEIMGVVEPYEIKCEQLGLCTGKRRQKRFAALKLLSRVGTILCVLIFQRRSTVLESATRAQWFMSKL
jgi:hypothetical protein